MSLYYHPGHQPRRPKQYQFPSALERVTEYCQAQGHLPVRMKFIARKTSKQGDPMAVLACPYCNRRSGWVVDRFSRGLRRL